MGWDIQSKNNNGTVKVKSGFSSDKKINTTEFIITDSSNKSGHQHVVVDANGETIYNQWNENH